MKVSRSRIGHYFTGKIIRGFWKHF